MNSTETFPLGAQEPQERVRVFKRKCTRGHWLVGVYPGRDMGSQVSAPP